MGSWAVASGRMSEKPTIRSVAEMLAQAHRDADPDTTDIFWSPDEEEVRLVEVSKGVGQTGDWPITPVCFMPGKAVPYPSAVVLLSVSEWAAVRAGTKKLPKGWLSLEELQTKGAG